MESQKKSKIITALAKLSNLQKFLLVSSFFAFSLGIAGYFMVKAQNTAIQFSELELRGSIYERKLRKLLETLPRHQWLSNQYFLGNSQVSGELRNAAADITTNFKHLNEADQELQKTLKTTQNDFQTKNFSNLKPFEIAAKWDDLNIQLQNLTPESSNALHLQLIDNIHKLLLYIGESSNLIFDPNVEVNYFIKTALFELPEIQLLIPKMILNAQFMLNKNEKENQYKEKLMINGALVSSALEAIKNLLTKGFNNQKNNQLFVANETQLKNALNIFLDSSSSLLKYTEEKLINPDSPKGTEAEYLILAGKALDDSFSLWDSILDQTDKIIKERIQQLKRQQLLSILGSLIGALLGLLLGIIIMREISRPLTNLANAAKTLSEGDLSKRVQIDYEDEVGRAGLAFNLMADSFQELIGRLQWTGIQLTNSTTEIANAAKEQENTIIEQEATTKQIAISAKEISSTSKEFAKAMNDLSSTAEETSSLAASGKAGLNQMETIMKQMVDASQNIATKLAVLNEKAGNITGIITTISKVADQTNLLSLNAAIEAEKAGEHGRTFAVIAREIRRLADQTGSATFDIEQTVNEIISAVSAGVMSVDKFSEEIYTGVSQARTVSEQLTKIIEQVELQTASFEDVNKGIQSQSLGAEQINDSIAKLSEAARHSSESIRQFHHTIERLNHAAKEMQTAILKIKH